MPLWIALLSYRGEFDDATGALKERLFDETLSVCTIFIHKLNLSTTINEGTAFTDFSLNLAAEDPDDFRIFINMADLLIDIFKHLHRQLTRPSVNRLLEDVIRMSYNRPLVSRFYKLVHVVLKTSSDAYRSIEEIGQERHDLILHYLLNAISLTGTFSGELQIACLGLILDAPLIFVKGLVKESAPIYKIAFRIGVSYLPLAVTAMSSLEKWAHHCDVENSRDFTREILPCLESYLQSKETLMDSSSSAEREIIKQATLIDESESLEDFQKRILLFIGSMSPDVVVEYIREKSLDARVTWDKKDLLKYDLPLSTNKLEIYLDKVLPRIIELALNSGDRQTKVSACECLFSIVTILLGSSSKVLFHAEFKYEALFKSLYPVLLKLGCDIDEVTRQIYQPFCLQLTHWLSSKMVRLSEVKIVDSFLNSAFAGLQDESDANLRDFSGACLAEFAKWTIKEKSINNVDEIVRMILDCSYDPSSRKKVAAAVAFNHIYKILREEMDLIKKYWLLFLHCFLRSLSECNDERIYSAISHVERVLLTSLSMFDEEEGKGDQPPEFRSNDTKGAAFWLLEQCGNDSRECREKSMELFAKISGDKRQEDFITDNEAFVGESELKKILFKDLHLPIEKFDCHELRAHLRSLDCFIWLMENEYVDYKFLLSLEDIFTKVSEFVKFTFLHKESIDEEPQREDENLKYVHSQIVMRILDFLDILSKWSVSISNVLKLLCANIFYLNIFFFLYFRKINTPECQTFFGMKT